MNVRTRLSTPRLAGMALACAASLIAFSAVQPAPAHAAYSGYKWYQPTINYFIDQSAARHTNWTQFIREEIQTYNVIADSTGHPRAGQVTSSANVSIRQGSIADPTVCGTMAPGNNGDRLSTALITLDDKTFVRNNSPGYSTPDGGGVCNFDNTVSHEYGHALGLAHTGLTTALMYGGDLYGITFPQYNDDEISLGKIY